MKKKSPKHFDSSIKKAEKLINDPEQTAQLITDANKKAYENKSIFQKIWDDLQTLMRMVTAWRKGEYKVIPWKSVLLAIAGLLYLINPIDLILDLLPFIGFADDLTVLAFVMNTIRKDIQKFREWELTQEEQSITTLSIIS